MFPRRTNMTSAMRVFLALVLLTLIPCFSAGQAHSIWTVVSATQIDSRIQRQLKRLATEHHASVRFSRQAPHYDERLTRSGNLVLEFRAPQDPVAFLADLKQATRGSAVEVTRQRANEGYILQSTSSHGSVPSGVHIEAATAAGLHLALLRIPDLLVIPPANLSRDLVPLPQAVHLKRNGTEAVLADYPSFPSRGVVEGFYGHPWSHDDRLDILRFEGQHGMNLYIYAPKDDPYHRKLWREPYPPEQMKRLSELADTAKENFVDFTFAISPGLSMTYSSDAEFQTLTRKLDSVSHLGVTSFALFLDDVPQELVHLEDRERFKTLAQAHLYLINRLYDHLKSLSPQNRLMVCPTTYTNEWGDREYIKDLGAGVNPDVPMNWTGTEVIPKKITVAEAAEWGRYLHRKPLVWDNLLANDGHPSWLILDPVRERETNLFSAVAGLFSNPMSQAHASMIPLQTLADYLWNPVTYDPDKSHRHAIISQYGKNAEAALAPLLQIFAGDAQASLFASILEERWSPVDVPAVESEISRLRSVVTSLQSQPGFEKLAPEISPIPDLLQEQLKRISADSAFKHLPAGKIQWDREQDILRASYLPASPVLDGDFAKWESGSVHQLNRRSQIMDGEDLWQGTSQFSARIALAWDDTNLYFGVDVTDPQLYQPFSGREILKGSALRLVVDTTLPIAVKPGRPAGVFDLYVSPGNFADVRPSIYCNEDFFPPRSRPHNYNQEITAVWRKTPSGFSGDIAIPASFFEREGFVPAQEVALSFGVQKTFPSEDPFDDYQEQIVFSSKESKLFPVEPQSPATLQRMVLEGAADRQ